MWRRTSRLYDQSLSSSSSESKNPARNLILHFPQRDDGDEAQPQLLACVECLIERLPRVGQLLEIGRPLSQRVRATLQGPSIGFALLIFVHPFRQSRKAQPAANSRGARIAPSKVGQNFSWPALAAARP